MATNPPNGDNQRVGSVNWPQPGTVVSIPILLFYRHTGIVSDRWHGGKPMVVSTSVRSGGVREESWDTFAQGRVVTVDGYPGGLPSWEVVRRARSLIGAQYDLLARNCEHFVTFVHGLKPQSAQLALTVVVALCIGALAAAR
jgi:hypothetical protein